MNENKSSPVLVLAAWLFVGLPLAWGVFNTVRNSMKLFQPPPPPAVHANSYRESSQGLLRPTV